MTFRYIASSLLILVSFAAPALAGNFVEVRTEAAMSGDYGLAVDLDGSQNRTFVLDTTPNDESVYRMEFQVDMNNLSMLDGNTFFLSFVRANPGGPDNHPSNRNIAQIFIVYREAGRFPYRLRLRCREDNGRWFFVGDYGLPTSGVTTVGLEWVGASAPGANDGVCRFLRDGVLEDEVTTLDTDTWNSVGDAWIGFLNRANAENFGTYYLDSFASYRTLSP